MIWPSCGAELPTATAPCSNCGAKAASAESAGPGHSSQAKVPPPSVPVERQTIDVAPGRSPLSTAKKILTRIGLAVLLFSLLMLTLEELTEGYRFTPDGWLVTYRLPSWLGGVQPAVVGGKPAQLNGVNLALGFFAGGLSLLTLNRLFRKTPAPGLLDRLFAKALFVISVCVLGFGAFYVRPPIDMPLCTRFSNLTLVMFGLALLLGTGLLCSVFPRWKRHGVLPTAMGVFFLTLLGLLATLDVHYHRDAEEAAIAFAGLGTWDRGSAGNLLFGQDKDGRLHVTRIKTPGGKTRPY